MSDADDCRQLVADRAVSTRRQFLRTTTLAAAGGSVAGCLGDDDPVTRTRSVGFSGSTTTPQTPTVDTERALARRTPTADAVDQPSLGVGAQRGVATDRLTATRDGTQVAVADFSLGVYETTLGEEREAVDYDLYWLWSAARTTADAAALSETISHVRLGDDTDLTVYGVTDAGETGAGVAPERTGTDDDEFALRWQGETSDAVVATGHCVGKRTGDRRPVSWEQSLSVV